MSLDFDSGYKGTIDGAACGSNQFLDVVNPATGKVFAAAPDAVAGQHQPVGPAR